MIKKFNKIFISAAIICTILLIFYIENLSYTKQTIDLTGSNDFWKTSLNINLKYDSELIIQPKRNDFDIPSEISINIIVNKKIAFNHKLKYIPNENKKLLGKYIISLESDNYFHKNTQEVYLDIVYDGKKHSIVLS